MIKRMINNNFFQSALTQGGSAFFAFMSFAILARKLSFGSFGNWMLFLTLITFLEMIKAGVVQTAVIKYASGENQTTKAQIFGTSWCINFVGSGLMGLILFAVYCIAETGGGLGLFLKYYLVYTLIIMPFNYYQWVMQVDGDFKAITRAKMFNSGLFFCCCLALNQTTVQEEGIAIIYIISTALTSLLCLFSRKTMIAHVREFNKTVMRRMFDFGKYHMLAFLGSNLLKSSDVFLIGGLIGPVGLAIYSIPLRLVEIIEMPLKSAIQVVFPMFSALDNQRKMDALRKLIERSIGVITLVYVPFIAVLFVYSDFLIGLVGGDKYQDAVVIFQIFLIYGLFLPFDRITGISLDAMGMPKLNFYKVLIMASVNIIGDIVAIIFYESLELVAIITVANALCGTMVGYYLVKKHLGISFKTVFLSGWYTILEFITNQKKSLIKIHKHEN